MHVIIPTKKDTSRGNLSYIERQRPKVSGENDSEWLEQSLRTLTRNAYVTAGSDQSIRMYIITCRFGSIHVLDTLARTM